MPISQDLKNRLNNIRSQYATGPDAKAKASQDRKLHALSVKLGVPHDTLRAVHDFASGSPAEKAAAGEKLEARDFARGEKHVISTTHLNTIAKHFEKQWVTSFRQLNTAEAERANLSPDASPEEIARANNKVIKLTDQRDAASPMAKCARQFVDDRIGATHAEVLKSDNASDRELAHAFQKSVQNNVYQEKKDLYHKGLGAGGRAAHYLKKGVLDPTVNATKLAGAHINHVGQVVRQETTIGVKSTQAFAGDASEKVQKKLQDTKESVGKAFDDAKKSLGETYTEARKNTGEAFTEAGKTTGKALQDAGKFTGNALLTVGGGAVGGVIAGAVLTGKGLKKAGDVTTEAVQKGAHGVGKSFNRNVNPLASTRDDAYARDMHAYNAITGRPAHTDGDKNDPAQRKVIKETIGQFQKDVGIEGADRKEMHRALQDFEQTWHAATETFRGANPGASREVAQLAVKPQVLAEVKGRMTDARDKAAQEKQTKIETRQQTRKEAQENFAKAARNTLSKVGFKDKNAQPQVETTAADGAQDKKQPIRNALSKFGFKGKKEQPQTQTPAANRTQNKKYTFSNLFGNSTVKGNAAQQPTPQPTTDGAQSKRYSLRDAFSKLGFKGSRAPKATGDDSKTNKPVFKNFLGTFAFKGKGAKKPQKNLFNKIKEKAEIKSWFKNGGAQATKRAPATDDSSESQSSVDEEFDPAAYLAQQPIHSQGSMESEGFQQRNLYTQDSIQPLGEEYLPRQNLFTPSHTESNVSEFSLPQSFKPTYRYNESPQTSRSATPTYGDEAESLTSSDLERELAQIGFSRTSNLTPESLHGDGDESVASSEDSVVNDGVIYPRQSGSSNLNAANLKTLQEQKSPTSTTFNTGKSNPSTSSTQTEVYGTPTNETPNTNTPEGQKITNSLFDSFKTEN